MPRKILVAALAVAWLHASPAKADTITNGILTLDVNATGSIQEVSNATAGFWNFGTPTIGFGIDGSNGFGREDANLGISDFGGSITSTATQIVAIGTWGDLSYERTYSLSGFDVLIDTKITNNGSTPETFKWFDSGDPDQGIPRGGGFNSFNDVSASGDFAIATNSSGVPPDLVKWTRTEPSAVLTFNPFGLEVFDSSELNSLFSAPYDPNLADQDIGMAIIWERTLGEGQSTTLSYFQSYGTAGDVGLAPEPATLALFGLGAAALGYRRRRKESGRQA